MPLRVLFVINGKHQAAKVAVLASHQPTPDALRQTGKNKLRITVRRLFTKDGVELLTCEDVVRHVTAGCTVVCSAGEDFAGQSLDARKSPPRQVKTSATAADGRQRPTTRVDHLAVRTPVDDEAVRQLERTALSYPAVTAAVGMPDLHPGNSYPIGAAFSARNEILPFLVGNDVGCGMALWMTSLSDGKVRQTERWAKRLEQLTASSPQDENVASALSEKTSFDHQLGTIGGGNHFAELQIVEDIIDEEKFSGLGLLPDRVFLLVHSGSRGLGQSILDDHIARHRTSGLEASSDEGKAYLAKHELACEFARNNRQEIARRLLTALQSDLPERPVLDIFHNNVVKTREGEWLHRKGAAPMDQGLIVIPGSRGALSYLALPTSDETILRQALCSVAHGAGRKWTRAKANTVGKQRFPQASSLRSNPNGSFVVCNSTALLYEEQPDAYKDVSSVMADLTEQGLVKVVATFKPILTYKN